MKICMLMAVALAVCFSMSSQSAAQNKVVVVPLGSTLNAGIPATGQTTCYVFTVYYQEEDCAYSTPRGQDGELQKGVAWPVPRFTNNLDGTVTDNLTKLVWLRDANCYGTKTWSGALWEVRDLSAGYCGLTDGSTAGDWRVPNRNEMESILHLGYATPALSDGRGTAKWTEGNVFANVETASNYWTSTTMVGGSGEQAWLVNVRYGSVTFLHKGSAAYVWPVRDGK